MYHPGSCQYLIPDPAYALSRIKPLPVNALFGKEYGLCLKAEFQISNFYLAQLGASPIAQA